MRIAHLESLPYRLPHAGIEMDQKLIRACNREHLPKVAPCRKVPKQLFTCIRRRAYMTVTRNGLAPQHHPGRVVLFDERELALRVGRRRDAQPLVVTVQTTVASNAGIQFERLGGSIYLAAHIPADCCRLPAPPRPARSPLAPKTAPAAPTPPEAGRYTLDWDQIASAPKRPSKRSKRWRHERQQLRRMKRKAGDSP